MVGSPTKNPKKPDQIPTKPGEIGVPGTLNYSGNIRSESNSKLFWNEAYSQPGQITWGQWEQLHRTDNCIATALQIVAAPLRDSEVEIQPVDDSDEENTICEFVKDNLVDWLEPTWPLAVEQMVSWGLGYGFSLHEKVWGTRDDARVAGGKAIYLQRLAQRLPSSIWVNGFIEQDGELQYIRQAGPIADGKGTKWVNVDLPAEKCLLLTWQKSGRNYSGFSQFRSVWYMAKMRAELLKVLAIGASREALGIPAASIDLNANVQADQLAKLQQLLENLVYHENAAIVLPPGVSIQWIYSPGANKGNVLQLWKDLGLAILETVQAQQVYLGTSGTGSRAVGQVHQIQQTVFVAGVRAWLEAGLNGIGSQKYTGLIKPIVDANFGIREKYPKLKLTLKPPKLEALELAQSVQALVTAGALHLTEDDEIEVRERLGLSTDPDRSKPIEAPQPVMQPGKPEDKNVGKNSDEAVK